MTPQELYISQCEELGIRPSEMASWPFTPAQMKIERARQSERDSFLRAFCASLVSAERELGPKQDPVPEPATEVVGAVVDQVVFTRTGEVEIRQEPVKTPLVRTMVSRLRGMFAGLLDRL